MPTLNVLQGPDKGRTYELLNEETVVGRSSEQVQLSDHSISRFHVKIHPDNGEWILCDLQSSNGTYLNGRRILAPTPLKHGDQIKIGTTLFVFGGSENVQNIFGADAIHDLVDLDLNNPCSGSSIVASIDSSEESVILQPPETADAVAAWNVVYQIAEAIGTIESVETFLSRVADILFDHLIADHLVLLLRSTSSNELEPFLVRRRRRASKKRPKIATSRRIIDHVTNTREGVLCANAMTDDRFASEDEQDSVHQLGQRSIICVPIVAHDEVHGVLHLDCSLSRHTYSEEQLRLAVSIGRLVGMAIENARLLETRVRTERLAAVGETVAYLSHQIRNILQGMQGGSDVVELGLRNQRPDTVRSGWKLVRRNLDRIYHLAMNMLTFSVNRQPTIEAAPLNPIVLEVLSLVQTQANEKSILVFSELGDLPPTQLDTEGIHQVIHNILRNAVAAAPREDGKITVRTYFDREASKVVLKVQDNGPGIPADAVELVFEGFHSSKGQGGTGLGLAAAKKIVRELHGEIGVDQNGEPGACIYFAIPVASVTLSDESADEKEGQPA